MAQMWAGRFSKNINEKVNDFNSSILFDQRLYPQDIQGSLAHSQMLANQNILTFEDKEAIHEGLKQIKQELDEGTLILDQRYEDIHMAVEEILTSRIGQAGKRLHTGRSRNDQVAVDMRLYCKEQIRVIQAMILDLLQALCDLARPHTRTIMPGYTHLQRAQPVTLAYYFMAYANMLRRDYIRLHNTLELMDECPLGSGALAGTSYDLDRFFTAHELGFKKPCDNAMDGVSDRDYCVELLSDLSILMMHMSRFSEEIIAWCSWEFHFIELDDAYSTGSSIMPQKKNPDICELVRGKTGRVYGDLMGMLSVLKSLPMAYNKDMQEDKEGVFDAIDTVEMCLPVFTDMLKTMSVKEENMLAAAQNGFINATDCADYLTARGMPFRDAYKISGSLVAWCIKNNKTLNNLPLKEYRQFSDLFDESIYEAVDLTSCVNKRSTYGAPSARQVEKQIENIEAFIRKQEPVNHDEA